MDYQTLTHSTWECKYHVVFSSKYRTKRLYGTLRRELVNLFHKLALQKGCKIEEGHMMPDHVHMLISIPPKYSVAHVVGFLKGKTPGTEKSSGTYRGRFNQGTGEGIPHCR